MQLFSRPVLACSIAAVLSSPALAHHSSAAFDIEKETTITGMVTAYSYRNPHVYITLSRQLDDGTTVSTEVEAGAASVISPLGFTRDSVQVGDVVSVAGNPGRRDPEGLLLGRELYKADGTYYPLNISSRDLYEDTDAVATSLEGTWFAPRAGFFGFLGGARNWPLTEAGQAAVASADPMASPTKDCVAIGAPVLMLYPVAQTIDVQDDRVDIQVDWLDSERTIWLDGRDHPPASETFVQGHSVGHWEGDVLVVDSANFAFNPIGLTTTLPSSTAKHLVERFELGDDGRTLVYSGTIEDAEYLMEPVMWTGTLEYRPDMEFSNEPCDLPTAQRFLDD